MCCSVVNQICTLKVYNDWEPISDLNNNIGTLDSTTITYNTFWIHFSNYNFGIFISNVCDRIINQFILCILQYLWTSLENTLS